MRLTNEAIEELHLVVECCMLFLTISLNQAMLIISYIYPIILFLNNRRSCMLCSLYDIKMLRRICNMVLVSVSENLWGGKIQLVLSLVIAAFELLFFWKCYPLEMKES